MKQTVDERVVQESNHLLGKNFRSATLVLLLVLTVKAVGVLLGLPWYALLPEAVGLFIGVSVWGGWMTLRRLWHSVDERIARERDVCRSTSWTIMHCAALLLNTALLTADQANAAVYTLSSAALVVIVYITLGRMTERGLYSTGKKQTVWLRVLCVTVAALALTPAMLWLMGSVRHETYEVWMYIVVEAIMLVSCLLGGVLASRLTKRSAANAEAMMKEAEGSDEE